MGNTVNVILKGAKRYIYNMLILMVDLSEDIYNKLKYIKCNYKELLINIFDETDQNISIENTDNYSKYRIVEPILLWFGSLFGVLDMEEKTVVVIGNNNKYHISQLEIVNMLFHNLKTYLLILVFGLLFMIYYFFT